MLSIEFGLRRSARRWRRYASTRVLRVEKNGVDLSVGNSEELATPILYLSSTFSADCEWYDWKISVTSRPAVYSSTRLPPGWRSSHAVMSYLRGDRWRQ